MRTSIEDKVRKGWKFSIFLVFIFVAGEFLFEAFWPEPDGTALAPQTELIQSFDDINFSSSLQSAKTKVIDKWTGESIRFNAVDEMPVAMRDIIENHLKVLSRLTGMKLYLDNRSVAPPADVIIRYLDRDAAYDEIEIKLKSKPTPRPVFNAGSRCKVYLWNNGYGVSRKGIVLYMPVDDVEFQFTCIIEELTQVLGLMADKAQYAPSIFSNDGYPQELTLNDKIMVRALYDGRIVAGMTRTEAMTLVREVIVPELIAAYEIHGEAALYQD